MSTASPLSVALLGPVRAWRDGQGVDIGAARRRAVFAMLAVRVGQAVSRDELIDGVWGESPPATAAASLYTYVSGLRGVLEPHRSKRSAAEVVVSTGAGYSLQIDPSALDVHRFEQHRKRAQVLAETNPEAALGELDDALALWRGDALLGVPGPFAESQRARLAELRLATVERRAELALALGRHADVIAELSGLTTKHPLREGLLALLVTALHRGGRQAEALRVYREARRALVVELGIEPGPALRRAHREALGGAPAPAPGGPARWTPDVAGNGLVGRDRELDLLRRAVTDVAAGRGRAVWLAGEPGVGKTALLTAGLAGAAEFGCQVASVAVDELAGRFPLRVLLDGLEVTGRSPDPRRAALARALADPAEAAPPWAASDPVALAAERVLAFVAELCARAPLVLVVDGLQWADEVSVLVWRQLLRLVDELPLLLVAAARPVPRRDDVDRACRAVVDAGGDVVELDPLTAPEVDALLTGLLGAPAGAGLRRLVGCAGGNPRYTRGVVDALLREGSVEFHDGVAEVDEFAEEEVSPALVAALNQQLAFLSPQAIEVLRWGALLGVEFSPADAATAGGRPVSDLVAAVDEATAAGVLVESGAKLAFRHPLVRHALHRGLPGPVRTALHRQAAQSLADAGAPVEVVATQLAAAPSAIDAWVVDWLLANADRLAERAPEVAAGLLRTAIDQPAVDPAHRERLAARLTRLLLRLGRRPDAEVRYVLARTEDQDLTAEMRWVLARLRHLDGAAAEAAAVLRDAIADDGVPPVWRARLAALLALVQCDGLGEPEAAEETAWQALREADDGFAQAHAHQALGRIGSARRDHEEALLQAELALAVVGTRQVRDAGLRTALSLDRAAALRELDRLDEADAVLRESREVAAGTPSAAEAHVARAVQDYWMGRWDGAVREVACADASSHALLDSGSALLAQGVAAVVAARRGHLGMAREHLRAADYPLTTAVEHESVDFLLAARAFTARAAGRPDEAVAALRPLLRPPRGVVRHQWLPTLARFALSAGEPGVAERVAEVAAEEAAVERKPAGAFYAAEHCRGLVEHDPAPVLAAAARYREVGRPVELAEALEDAATLLAARGERTRALAASAEAAALYRGMGAELDARRVEVGSHGRP
ncbi:DNA-binding SARP family transcriptional activator/tetratricopeptide (TPR) repeat protein [Saccharothrix coeruleofusca]|uniref:BTAD domain-containing putative transcriptional regulator n=1 Tax=Saccharothrix coeruleofusca TaxID=33919 RepID=UPI001AE67208|nr:BTAD domain-containing putative transcriptional regulator [Saccharothrix coeruleofusca]MBP2335973.1 DNA-binding SARP family transcriptional activator/tetratricopeptide (TPR) repeat protein [Saccharothrix coeruleofusca]